MEHNKAKYINIRQEFNVVCSINIKIKHIKTEKLLFKISIQQNEGKCIAHYHFRIKQNTNRKLNKIPNSPHLEGNSSH